MKRFSDFNHFPLLQNRNVLNQTRNIPTSSSYQIGFHYDYLLSIDFTNATPKVSYNKKLRTIPTQNRFYSLSNPEYLRTANRYGNAQWGASWNSNFIFPCY